MIEIQTENVYINNSSKISTDYVEEILKDKFVNILRWAIVKVSDDKLKICVTYEQETD